MPFLTARWKDLIFVNYPVPEEAVRPYVPAGCEIDTHEGRTFASLVLFEFLDTRVFGVRWPLHTDFSEINLRLYVKHRHGDEVRRGVVFVQELVPRFAIAAIARTFYSEPYKAGPIERMVGSTGAGRRIIYRWNRRNKCAVVTDDDWQPTGTESEERFIIEHYWGYTPTGPNRANQFQVAHPSWETAPVQVENLALDFGADYGERWAFLNDAEASSTFIARGSAVEVLPKEPIAAS